MTRYIYDPTLGGMISKDDGMPLLNQAERASPPCCPQVRSDIKEYLSPVTGLPVDGRAARREDLKRTGCREVDPSEHEVSFRSERYARAHWQAQKTRQGG